MTDWRRAPGRPLNGLEALLANLSAERRGETVRLDPTVCGYCTDPEQGRRCGAPTAHLVRFTDRRVGYACAEHAAEAAGWRETEEVREL